VTDPTTPLDGPFSRDRFDLARLLVAENDSLRDVIAHATQISARALGAARVGVWVFSEDHQTLTCLHTHFEGVAPSDDIRELRAKDFPRYMKALEGKRWICADDALTNDATSELAEGYLKPLGITSMLDAPIFRGELLFGVVCHEHVGPKRTWSERDKGFAGSAADILALVFEQSMHLESEKRLRVLEIECLDTQKLETLGRFTLGIAHDFNGVLSAVRLAAATLQRSPDPADLEGISEELHAAALVGAELTGALLRFAKTQTNARGRIDLGDTVSSLEPLLRLLTREAADLKVTLPNADEKLVILAAPSDIQQILLNLVANAQQALTGRGRIGVSVTRVGSEALLSVDDTGRGIPEEVAKHLFDPFFTTKQGGTGWGLATVRSIATELGAHVAVVSKLGEGATFTLRFPLI
jgi:two-component system cell cycle sensor histidine kinase/response regulator CckA